MIETGVVDSCGMQHGATAFLHGSESTDQGATARAVETAATAVASAIGDG